MTTVHKSASRLFAVLFTLIVTTAGHAQAAPINPRNFVIDELSYYKQLVAARPVLMAETTNAPYDAMVIKPMFRPTMLTAPNTYDTIEKSNWNNGDQSMDKTWIASQQSAETTLGQTLYAQFLALYPTGTQQQYQRWVDAQNIVKPAGYPVQYFVGYFVGVSRNIENSQGIDYKVFFTFHNVDAELTPQVYQGFSQALLNAGFWGDSKIPVIPGQTFMQYNQIILHANTVALAELAEGVGRYYFGNNLIHMARGVDAAGTDWHDYILQNKGNISNLPAEAQAYVLYKN